MIFISPILNLKNTAFNYYFQLFYKKNLLFSQKLRKLTHKNKYMFRKMLVGSLFLFHLSVIAQNKVVTILDANSAESIP
jgi:hypothetical protein